MSIKPNRKTRDSDLSKIQQLWIGPPKDKPWAKLYIDIMDGERWRGLSVNARRVLDALVCQHFRYCQRDNGDLQVSYSGFEKSGVSKRDYVSAAIKELLACGIIETKEGLLVNPNMRPPTLYGITFYKKDSGYVKDANRSFVWMYVEIMESPEWCGLSINAKRIMDRLLIENRRHQYKLNGNLRVSYSQFVGHGVGRRLIAPALKELVDAGLLEISSPKRRGPLQPFNLYRLRSMRPSMARALGKRWKITSEKWTKIIS